MTNDDDDRAWPRTPNYDGLYKTTTEDDNRRRADVGDGRRATVGGWWVAKTKGGW